MSFPTKDEMIEELRDMCEKRLIYAEGLRTQLRDACAAELVMGNAMAKLKATSDHRKRLLAQKNKIIRDLTARVDALEE